MVRRKKRAWFKDGVTIETSGQSAMIPHSIEAGLDCEEIA